jgi:AraC-like DNA-binding protein
MGRQCEIAVRFHEPPEDLRRFFTTFYRAEFVCPDGAVRDALQPEWAGLRFFDHAGVSSRIEGGDSIRDVSFSAMGPTSVPVQFSLPTVQMWGIGLLPLGWATFMDEPASAYANRIFDGRQEAAFARFVPLADTLTGDAAREDEELGRIVDFFRHRLARHEPEDPRVLAIHQVLVDPFLPDVAGMVERTGLNPRTLERVCRRAFGFSPKKLLRRQRFMRSLAQFMLDPSLGWIGAIDALYFDQSHFVRDCREFLGMTPSEYAAQDHPVLAAFMRERLKAHGSAAQTLDVPS